MRFELISGTRCVPRSCGEIIRKRKVVPGVREAETKTWGIRVNVQKRMCNERCSWGGVGLLTESSVVFCVA